MKNFTASIMQVPGKEKKAVHPEDNAFISRRSRDCAEPRQKKAPQGEREPLSAG